MFPRLVLALVAAVISFLPSAARTLDAEHAYTVVVRMRASTAGWVQLFADPGEGFSETIAPSVPLVASDRFLDYQLPIPTGRYVALRLDPNIGAGRYEIADVSVVDTGGRRVVDIPVRELVPVNQLTQVDRGSGPLVVDAPAGANDPSLLYRPAAPLWLLPRAADAPRLVRELLLDIGIALATIWLLELLFRSAAAPISARLERWRDAAAAHPRITVALTAFAATLIACYPTLFLDRSLVSPNNGPVAVLYEHAPFVPAPEDPVTEDIRASDVGAAMWAFVPYSRVEREAIARGELPLWNRYNSAGVSLWGQGQSFLLDPLHWITFLGRDPAPAWDLAFAAHRFIGAWGMGVAALVATGATLPAAVAAASWPFLGDYAFRFNHPAAFVLTYAPWVLACWFALAGAQTRRGRAGAALGLAVASSLLLAAAPPKEAAGMLAVTWSAGALAMLLTPRPRKQWLQPIVLAAAAAVAFLLLMAPQWWIFLDTMRASASFYDAPRLEFAGRRDVLSLILGSLAPDPIRPGLQTLTAGLALVALCAPLRLLRTPAAAACVAAAAGAIAIAAGVVPEHVLLRIPLIGNIHSLEINLFTATLVPLAIVAALGAQAAVAGTRLQLALIGAATVAAATIVFRNLGGLAALGEFDAWTALFALSGGVLFPLALRAAARSFPRLLPAIAASALAWALLAPGGQQVGTHARALDHVLVQPRPRVELAAPAPVTDAIRAAAAVEPARALGLSGNLYPGTSGLWGIEGVAGPDALFLPELAELFDAAGPRRQDNNWMRYFNRAQAEHAATVLDMLNVGFLVGRPDQLAAGDRTLAMQQGDILQAARRPSAWPRAFFIDRVGTYAAPADLVAQAQAAGHAIAAIQSGDAEAAGLTREFSAGPAEPIPATRYRLTANATTFHVQAPHAGVAVLAEAHMAGDFVATRNGEPVPYFRVNHAFKGVAIPRAGDWEIRFEYRPRHWYASLAAAAAGGVVLLALALGAIRG